MNLQKLLSDLQTGSDRQRRAASYQLGRSKDPSVIPHLINAYNDPDPMVRQNIEAGLRRMNSSEAQAFLDPALASGVASPQGQNAASISFGVRQAGVPFRTPKWQIHLTPEMAEFAKLDSEERITMSKDDTMKGIEFGNAFISGYHIAVNYDDKKYLFKLASPDLARLRAWLPPKPPKTVSDLKKELIPRGGALILLAMAHFVFSNYLDPMWGGVLLGIGLLTLFISSRYMFIVVGILLMLAGAVNLFSGFGGANAGRWFGLLQIGWGIEEFTKFTEYASLKREN